MTLVTEQLRHALRDGPEVAVLGIVAHAGEVLPVAVVGRDVVVDQEQLEQLSPHLRHARLA